MIFPDFKILLTGWNLILVMGWLAGFTACQLLLGYLMPKSVIFEANIWLHSETQSNDNEVVLHALQGLSSDLVIYQP